MGKGSGAEERLCAQLFLAWQKISVMLSQQCGALSYFPLPCRKHGAFYGHELGRAAFAASSAFSFVLAWQIHFSF